MTDRKKPSKRHRASLGETRGEPTLIGEESSHDLSRRQLVWVRERQRHRIQGRAVLGLLLLLGVVLPLGALALVGVAAGWYPSWFALSVLGLTLTPSFAAWRLVVRWAFARKQSDAG